MTRSVLALILALTVTATPAATIPADITLALNNQPALDLIEALARQCQCGIAASPEALTAMEMKVRIVLDHTPWDRALSIIADSTQLDVTVDHDLLRVNAVVAGHSRRLVRQVYDLRLLTSAINNEPPISLEVRSERLPGSHIGPTSEPESKPEINEFIEIIQKQIAPTSWMQEGVAIEEWRGTMMVITQSPAVHAEISRLLAHLEARRGRQIVFRAYRLGALPAGTGPVLDAHQWAALANRPPPAAVFLVRNEQQQSHFSGIIRQLVIDADQNQFVHAPVTDTQATGLSLGVRATATIGGVRVETKLWATVDSQFPTTAVRDEAGQPLVTITTPHVTMDRSGDVREIPTGGAAIYRFGEHAYALTAEVPDFTPGEAAITPPGNATATAAP